MVDAATHQNSDNRLALCQELRMETMTVTIGWEEGQTFHGNRPFPLVLKPAYEGVNFIQL